MIFKEYKSYFNDSRAEANRKIIASVSAEYKCKQHTSQIPIS